MARKNVTVTADAVREDREGMECRGHSVWAAAEGEGRQRGEKGNCGTICCGRGDGTAQQVENPLRDREKSRVLRVRGFVRG
jgi:hypothetical protein